MKCIILVLLYCEKYYTDSSLVIKMQMRCQMGQRNTFPVKLCALLLVKLTKMGVTGIKLIPHPKGISLFSFWFPGDTPWKYCGSPFGGSPSFSCFTFSNFVDSFQTNQPMAGMTKLLLLKEFIKNLRIIHAPGHLTQHQQNQCK